MKRLPVPLFEPMPRPRKTVGNLRIQPALNSRTFDPAHPEQDGIPLRVRLNIHFSFAPPHQLLKQLPVRGENRLFGPARPQACLYVPEVADVHLAQHAILRIRLRIKLMKLKAHLTRVQKRHTVSHGLRPTGRQEELQPSHAHPVQVLPQPTEPDQPKAQDVVDVRRMLFGRYSQEGPAHLPAPSQPARIDSRKGIVPVGAGADTFDFPVGEALGENLHKLFSKLSPTFAEADPRRLGKVPNLQNRRDAPPRATDKQPQTAAVAEGHLFQSAGHAPGGIPYLEDQLAVFGLQPPFGAVAMEIKQPLTLFHQRGMPSRADEGLHLLL